MLPPLPGMGKKRFSLYLPSQGHSGCFEPFFPRKDIGVDDEQEARLSVLTWEDAPRLITRACGKQMLKRVQSEVLALLLRSAKD